MKEKTKFLQSPRSLKELFWSGPELEYKECALHVVGTNAFYPHSLGGIARPVIKGFTMFALTKPRISPFSLN